MALCEIRPTRKDTFMMAEESVSGELESMAVSTHGVLAQNISFGIEVDTTNTNENTGALDEGVPIIGGQRAQISGEIVLRGLDSLSTEPDWFLLLKAAAMAVTQYASPVPASPEAVTAGTDTGVTLGASFSNTEGDYNGAALDLPGVNPNDPIPIRSHNASRQVDLFYDNNDVNISGTAQIPAQFVLSPVSPASGTMPRISAGIYSGGNLHQLYGGVVTASLRMNAGQNVILSFTISGVYQAPIAAEPDAVLAKPDNPFVFRNGFSRVEGLSARCTSVAFNLTNQIFVNPDVEHPTGYCPPEIVSRRITGDTNPTTVQVTTRDPWAKLLANQNSHMMFMAKAGAGGAGNRLYIGMNNARLLNAPPDASGEVARTNIQTQLDDANDGFFITIV
ncbi:MAG: phage tail tube protein [Pseudomonadota bacterium]